MSKFRKGGGKGMPAISTASLPDIVFMLLFFFMVTTVMRETTLFVTVLTPKATEIKKMEKKSLISYIYIGAPTEEMEKSYGSAARIQLNDVFAEVDEIQAFIAAERENKIEKDKKKMTISIKADGGNKNPDHGPIREGVKMGIITDVKQELRKAKALRINYSTRKGGAKK